MRKLFLITLSFSCFSLFVTAQQDTLKYSRIYQSRIRLYDKTLIRGILYQVQDSSVLVANTLSKTTLFSGKYQITKVSYYNFPAIHLCTLHKGGKAFLIGAIGGLLTGAIIGYSLGDDICNNPYGMCILEMTAKDKSMIGGVIGVLSGSLIGAIIGSIRINIPINGRIEKLNENRSRLMRYSYIH